MSDVAGYEIRWNTTGQFGDRYGIVSFFTDEEPYRECASRLNQSLLQHGLSGRICVLPPFKAWEHACAHKATFLRRVYEVSECPLVWIDADAVVRERPILFDALIEDGIDLAVHRPVKGRDPWWNDSSPVISGTIFMGRTNPNATLAALTLWERYCDDQPDVWDQIHLARAIEAMIPQGVQFASLPASYMRIFDNRKMPSARVIEHFQASRQSTKKRRRPKIG